jgi:hypothetical protein
MGLWNRTAWTPQNLVVCWPLTCPWRAVREGNTVLRTVKWVVTTPGLISLYEETAIFVVVRNSNKFLELFGSKHFLSCQNHVQWLGVRTANLVIEYLPILITYNKNWTCNFAVRFALIIERPLILNFERSWELIPYSIDTFLQLHVFLTVHHELTIY